MMSRKGEGDEGLLSRVVSLGSLGRFSDDEDSYTSSTSGEEASLWRESRSSKSLGGRRLRPPGRFGRQSESDDWTEGELGERAAVWAGLSESARETLEGNELLLLRLVRGYWKYDRRTATVTGVAETVAEMRRRYCCEQLLRRRLPQDEDFHRRVWPSWILGEDRYGHPIVFERLSALDWDRALRLSTDELVQLRIQALEALQAECARVSGRSWRVYKVVFVIDVSGASSWTLMSPRALEFAKVFAKIVEQMYSDAAWMNVVVNAPAVARAAWRVIERIVDEETREIVRFLPVGPSCLDALREIGLDREIVPRCLGGPAHLGPTVADVIDRLLDQAAAKGENLADIAIPLGRARSPAFPSLTLLHAVVVLVFAAFFLLLAGPSVLPR